MPRGDHNLLAEIERDALDDRASLITTLRKCIALGAQTSSKALCDWANRELDGYTDDDELPKYRIINVPLKIDAVTFTHQIRGERISSTDLPDFAQEFISDKLELAGGVSKLQGYITSAKGLSVKLEPVGTPDLLKLWNYELQGTGRTVMALYWEVSVGSIEGIMGEIRTTLVRLVSEMRANASGTASTPSPDQAERAVNVVLRGGRRNQVNVSSYRADTGATISVEPSQEPKESGWGRITAIGTVILVIVAIITAWLTYLALHH